MAKILITGGAGFVGFHLALKLSEGKSEIVLADNFSRAKKDADLESLLKKKNVKTVEVDLTDIREWKKLGTGYDYVYHLASINSFKLFQEIPHEVLRVGMSITMNALEWFRKENGNPNAKILYVSSNEVYMGTTVYAEIPVPTPENVPVIIPDTYDPRWSYACQKMVSELFFIHYAKAYNIRMVIVRPQNIYGPRAGYDSMIPKFIDRIAKRVEPFPLISPNENRSSCYIGDVVEAMKLAIESPKTDSQTYNIGASHETTVKEILDSMFNIMGWHPQKFDTKESPDDSKKHSLADVSKIKRDTGWEAKVSLKEGLKKTIGWYTDNPK
jgi:nucleoside-diphosphate-sugar epimerase